MGCEAGQCSKTSTPQDIFIMTPSLEGWPTKAKEAPSLHEARLALLETNPVFSCLRDWGIWLCCSFKEFFTNFSCLQFLLKCL